MEIERKFKTYFIVFSDVVQEKEENIPSAEIDFNFCTANIPADPKCPLISDTYAHIIPKGSGTCYGLKDSETGKPNIVDSELLDTDGNVNGISLKFSSSNSQCEAEPTRTYSLTVNLMCGTNTGLSNPQVSGDDCDIVLQYNSKQGCPVFALDKFWTFMKKYNGLWGVMLIVLGLFLAFFGNKFVNAVIYIMATLAAFFAGSMLFFQLFMKNVEKQWIQWVIIGLIFVGANLIGMVLVKTRKYGIAVLAGFGGAMLGLIITTTFVVGSSTAWYGIVIGTAAVMACLAFYIEAQIIMLVTSFAGSYFVIRGISLYAGGFPSETELQKEITAGAINWTTFDKTFYGYLAGIAVLTVLTFYFQIKNNTEKKTYGKYDL
jgi:hypothetical protein